MAAAGILYSYFAADCLWWAKPTSSEPVVPAHPVYPNVPTLVLDGNMDNRVPLEEVSRVAPLFPNSTLVTVAGAGHGTWSYNRCAASLESTFIETLRVGNTRCVLVPETVYPGLGRFPVAASDALPAIVDPRGRNQIGIAQRKAVTVAVAAATDALLRLQIGGFGSDRCLRGGVFQTAETLDGSVLTLVNCSFARDVAVNGTIVWGAGEALSADLVLSGTGTAGGTIHVAGTWQAPGPVGNFTVSGTLGGQRVAVLVPEA